MRDPRPPAQPRRLQPVDGPPSPIPIEPSRRWGRQEIDYLIGQFFASPFGMAQRDHERYQLLVEIVETAVRVAGDPTRWDDRLVTALLVAEMPHQAHIADRDRRQVPDLLRGFIGFCAAERGIAAHEVDDALRTVAWWSEDWAGDEATTFDPWSAERRMLDELRVEVGTSELLWGLDANPLPEEPFDRSSVPPDAADAVAEVLTHADGACTVLFDSELRTAARRLIARVVAGHPALLVDQAHRAVSAAVLVWVVARANGAFGSGRTRVMDLMSHLGLR